MTAPQGPLAGIRVIEMAGLGPAPFCGMLLADMGAEVIRVDRIGDADLGLKRDPRFDIVSRGKRSAAIDVKSAAGRDAVLRLVARADVLIEGFRPGVMERLGLGPDTCLAVNPRLVFGRITGWGQDGPLAHAAGHDLNYIALVGALDAIGDAADRPPVAPLNLVGDFGGGSMYLAFGIASALVERASSGRGQVIDAAIVDGVTHLLAGVHGQVAGGSWQAERGEHVLGGAAPWNTVYATADGRYVSICAIEQRFYAELLRRLGLDPTTLPDRMDRAQWPALRERFAAIFASRTQAEWRERLEGSDACFAPVLGVREVAGHPHVQARGLLQAVGGIPQPAVAPRLDRTPGAIHGECIARPGQHTDAVLADWGFDAEEIAALRAGGVAA
ncbi:CaiB/BaiF CoA transferase family protein [Piscinibacter koreensis]|uniref:CoA transferase n=1 Tax=Piscinibacter koreensis TaxID=2742824 RepID=A0A7Y6NN31_9BURK|nr:CaiB/BaiF CoA-transferase family protein [Schlegelella koreensis]NUZ06119.1 CoA transferase [Schlegelella koreensis]